MVHNRSDHLGHIRMNDILTVIPGYKGTLAYTL